MNCRRGASGEGLAEAARRLIDGTRANYKRQNLEKFDFSKLDEAARLAKVTERKKKKKKKNCFDFKR